MPRTKLEHSARWRLMYKPPQGRWITLRSVGSKSQASAWQFRYFGSGSYHIKQPTTNQTYKEA